MTEEMVQRSGSKLSSNELDGTPKRDGSALSSLSNEYQNKHMLIRRKSQGLDKSIKKNY